MKVDLKKQLADYHPPNGRFELVTVPPRHYLMIDGHGDPNTSPVYAEALAALFPLAYAVKFVSKNLGRDYVVMPLQGLWWADDMTAFTTRRDKSTWHWTLLNLLPDWITPEHVDAARAAVAAKGAAPSTAGASVHIWPPCCWPSWSVGPNAPPTTCSTWWSAPRPAA